MKNTLLLTTLVAGLALAGCNKSTRTSTADTTIPPATDATATTTPTTTDSLGTKMDRAGDRVADAGRDVAASMRQAGRDVSARMKEWRLSSTEIQSDVMANRPVVRSRTDAMTPAANFDADTLEKSIQGRLTADPQLANLKFDVNANKKGEVELEGKAATTDQIAHAMAVSLDHDNVTKVTSKIKLDPNAGK
jgi:hypothetical protein